MWVSVPSRVEPAGFRGVGSGNILQVNGQIPDSRQISPRHQFISPWSFSEANLMGAAEVKDSVPPLRLPMAKPIASVVQAKEIYNFFGNRVFEHTTSAGAVRALNARSKKDLTRAGSGRTGLSARERRRRPDLSSHTET